MAIKPDRITNDNELPGGKLGHPFWSCRLWWARGHIQWLAGKLAHACHIKYCHDGVEGERMICFGIPRLFDVYIVWAARPVEWYVSKNYGIHIADGAICFEWANGDDWYKGQPWWQSFHINPAILLFGDTHMKSTELRRTAAELFLPEGPVPVTVVLEYAEWRRPRWPFVVYKKYTGTVEAKDPRGISAPGKGENSWDQGDNNIMSLSCEARTVEEALGSALKSVLSTRMRHAGTHAYKSREDG